MDYPGGYKSVRERIRERRQEREAKPLLLEAARRELSKVSGSVAGSVPYWEPVPLMDWIPEISHGFDAPTHLAPLVERLEAAAKEPVEFCFSVPPRHFKSFTIFHAVAWWWKQDPTLKIAYITFAKDTANEQLNEARRIIQRSGVRLGGRSRQDLIETAHGGLFKGEGLRGQLTGRGFDIIIVDDPHGSREEAASGVIRRRVVDGFWADIYTRQLPRGTSVFVVHTRWHPDDLIANLQEAGWEYTNLPAVDDDGNALCPKHWPLEKLKPHMANEHEWAALFMGQPRPRGQELFGDATYCDMADVPSTGRDAIGVDLAYTAKTQADYSVAIALRKAVDRTGTKPRDVYYVVDMVRKQCQAPDFAASLRRMNNSFPGAPMRWYAAGTEKGSAQFIKAQGIPLEDRNATGDKFQRAQPVSAAWNDGRVIVPRDAPWAQALVTEVTGFTGVNDFHDDIVDALAAAFDAASVTAESVSLKTWGKRPTRSLRTAF